jgi:hypothetical protein
MATDRERLAEPLRVAQRQAVPVTPEETPGEAAGADLAPAARVPARLPSASPRSGRGFEAARTALLLGMQQRLGNRAVQRFMQRTPAPAAQEVAPAGDDLAARIRAAGSGVPLEAGAQRQIEQGLGGDLSGVRIHTDAAADHLARAVEATAFTTGQDIFFRAGAYAPSSAEGMRLLTHEATHVVQQAAGPVAGTLTDGVRISSPDDHFEQAAQEAAFPAAPIPSGPNEAITVRALDGDAPAVPAVQRQPPAAPPSVDDRLAALEKQAQVTAKKSDCVQLDLNYRAQFGAVVAAYEQVVYRLGGGFQAGLSSFSKVSTEAAQAEAVRAQLLAAIVTLAIAAAFEPFIMPALGKVRPSLADSKEAIENPFNTAVQGAGNVAATAATNAATNQAQPPGSPGGGQPAPSSPQGVVAGGDPLSFQSQNLAELARHREAIETAFAARSTKTAAWTDDQWLGFDRAAQEAIYAKHLAELKAFPTVEKLKDDAQIATIIEKLLWALWVQQNAYGRIWMGDSPNQVGLTLHLGGERERRFEELGIDKAAGVAFHWYGNRPDDWRDRMLAWAGGFKESLST